MKTEDAVDLAQQTWREYTRRIHESFTSQAPLIGGLGTPNEVFFLALALSGEVGELCNFLKKRWRGDGPIDGMQEALVSELADIRIYLEHLSRALGVDLEQACEAKCEELRDRWPERGRLSAGGDVALDEIPAPAEREFPQDWPATQMRNPFL